MNTVEVGYERRWAMLALCLLAVAGCGGGAANPGTKELVVVVAESAPRTVAKIRVGEVIFKPEDLDKVIVELSGASDGEGPLRKLRVVAPPQLPFGEILDLLKKISKIVSVETFDLASKEAEQTGVGKNATEHVVEWRANRQLHEEAALRMRIRLSPRAEGDYLIELDQLKAPVADMKTLTVALRQLQEPTGPWSKSTNVIIQPRKDAAWDYVLQAMAATYAAGYEKVLLGMTPWDSDDKRPLRWAPPGSSRSRYPEQEE